MLRPKGLTQLRPRRPRPLVCCSANTTAPWPSVPERRPSSTSALVESTTRRSSSRDSCARTRCGSAAAMRSRSSSSMPPGTR